MDILGELQREKFKTQGKKRDGESTDILGTLQREKDAVTAVKPINNGYASVADINRSTNGSGVYSASGALQQAARELTATLPESRPARTTRTHWDGTTRERNDRGALLRGVTAKPYDTEGALESPVDRALAMLSGAGAAAVRGLSDVDSAASEDRKRTENALRNLETYTVNRDAATTDAEREHWQKLADAAQRQIKAYSGAAETKRQNAEDAAAALEATRDNFLRAASEGDYNARAGRALETIEKYGDNRYSDDLGGLVGSNYAVGRLSQNSAYAWDEYLNSPTEENRKIAQTYDLALRNNSENNADALEADGGFQTLIKSAAGYVPQLMDQTAARLKGGAVGLLAGNANAGQAAGAAADMYRITRGAAFRELLNAGIPEEQARAMAKDEAFVSSLIEYADSAAEFAVFGGQNIVRLLMSNGAEAAGTQAGKSAARNALKKLAAYLGNIPQEYAEEYAQEGVSIANENRYASGTTDSGILGLARDAVGMIWNDGVRGGYQARQGDNPNGYLPTNELRRVEQSQENRRRMQEAGNEGARIAALFGLLEAGGGYAAEREVNRRSVNVGAEAISDALNEARTNGAVSDAAAGAVLQNEPVMELLTRMGEVELTDDMDRAQRTDAVRDALTRLAENAVAREEEQPTVEAAAEVGAQRRENPPQTLLQPQTLTEKQFGLRDVSEAQLARDIRTARESFAPTLGREGARAFANRYNEDAARLIAPDEAFKGFNQVYSAALKGEELPEVNIPNSLAYAAQLAGESDRRTAAQAKYFGENAGLTKNRSGYPRNLSSKDERILDNIGKAFGTQIRFADSIVGRDERGTFTSNAKIENGVLTIAKDAEDPVRVAFFHEITHRVREVSPEAYSAMSRFVLDNMSDERFSSALRERMERYGSTDISDVSEELVADAYGTILGDSELLDRFAGTNRSAAQRILDAIRDIIVKIRRALSGGSQAMLTEDQKEAFRDLQGREEEMARLLEEALERTRERAAENENAATAGGERRDSRKVDSKGRELTEAQAEYFKDSKVRDENGNLIPVYHGTANEFTSFDNNTINKNFGANGGDLGFYFTPFPEDAKGYASEAAGKAGGGKVMEVYLNLTNPLVVEGEGWGSAARQADLKNSDIKRWLKNGNYDGVIIRSTDEEMENGMPDTIYVAFSSNQAKNVDNQNPTSNPDIRFSRKRTQRDADYMAAVERGDTDEAQKMVDEAARAEGYTIPNLYHGTRAFGFTAFDPAKSDDRISIFTTSNPRTAETYSGETQRKRISDASYIDVDSLSGNELLAEAKKHLKQYADYEVMTDAERQRLMKETRGSIDAIFEDAAEFINSNEARFNSELRPFADRFLRTFSAITTANDEDLLYDAVNDWQRAVYDISYEDRGLADEMFDKIGVERMYSYTNRLHDLMYRYDLFTRPNGYEWEFVFDNQIKIELGNNLRQGIYALYGKPGRQLSIDANGSNWDNIRAPRELRLPSWKRQSTRDIAEAAKAEGYDSVVFYNLRDNGGETAYNGESDVYIFFDPNDLKSADPVTYDDKGNVIPISERFNERNEDIRYSRKRGDVAQREAQLLRENDFLRQQVDALRGELRRSDPAGRIDPKNVRKAARELIEYYGSTVKADEITDDMQRLYDLMGTGGTENNELSYDAAREIADTVARKIAENALDETGSLYADYEELRKFLRDADIIVTAEDTRNITDWNDWRKARMGKIKIKRGETSNIDVVYDELSERWPEFFLGDVLSVEDQLQHMADVSDAIYADRGRNPYDPYMDQAVIGIGNDIMERFFELPQYKTFADRQEARIEALREKMSEMRQRHKEAMQRSLERVRKNRDERLAKQRDRFKAKTEAGRQKQRAAVLRKRIERHAAEMSQKLLRPSDKQHIPEALRSPVAAMLSAINRESAYDYLQSGYFGEKAERVPRGEGDVTTKRTQAFQALKEQYQKALAESDGNMVIDPDLIGEQGSGFQGLFDQVLSYGDTPIRAMNEEQLSTIWKVLRSVEHSISTYGKLMAVQKYKTTEQLAKRFYDETASRRDRSSLRGLDPALDLENPYTFFSQYGEAGKAIYRMLRDAQDGQRRKLDEVIRLTQSAVDSETVDKLRKERHEITTSLRDHLTLTTSQLMEIYLLSKREQALNHLMKGGIVQPEIEKDGKQKRIPRGSETVLLSLNDLEKMRSLLTPEQIKIADALQAITTDVLAVWGNEAAMQAYGYRKFTEPNYWPIKSASEVLHSNVEKDGGNVRSIKNIGMAKAVIPQASNAVNVNDVFDTFAGHTADMLDYSTWLLPMEDAQRFFNFKFKDEEGNTKTTVKFQLDRVGGANGKASRYWMNLMSDIQNGIDHGRGSDTERLVNRIVGNTKGAAVGANLRVVIQQPTAFFRAGAVMDPASLTKGLFSGVTGGNAWEKAQQWAGIARIKEAGGFDQGSRRSIGNELYDDRSRIEKLNDAAGWLAGRADAVTWGRLWNAAEWETKRLYPDLPNGSSDFYQKAAEIFTDTIDQTQVVDGVLQRSAIMRSGDRLTQQMTSFMGEPIMSLNMLLRAWDNVRYETIPKRRSAAIKTLGRSALALLVTDAVNALAQSLVDAMRDDDKDNDYSEKFNTALTGIEGDEETAAQFLKNVYFGSNFVQNINPLNRLPVLKDAQSLMQGFSVERLDASTISDIIQAHNRLVSGKVTPGYGVYRLIGTVAKLAGIPAVNLERDVLSVVRSAVYATDNYSAMYDLERAIYTPLENVGRFYDVLTMALRNGDADSYQALRERMAEDSGKSSKDIDDAVKSRLNKGGWMNPQAAEVLGVVDKYAEKQEDEDKFSAESLDPAAYTRYNNQRAAAFKELRGVLEATKEFKALSDADKDKAIGWAKAFADHRALADNSGGQYQIDTKWEKAALDAERAGIGAGVYLLFHTVYETTSDTKDADGKPVKGERKSDKVRTWLESQRGLTNGQREFLWHTVYSGEW